MPSSTLPPQTLPPQALPPQTLPPPQSLPLPATSAPAAARHPAPLPGCDAPGPVGFAGPARGWRRSSRLAPWTWWRRAVLRRLAALHWGELELVDGESTWTFGGRGAADAADAPRVRCEVLDRGFYAAVALRGSVGVAEAYASGQWRCDDPVGLVRLFVRNRAALDGLEGGLARLSLPLLRLAHRLRRNTRDGARRNIAAHYDLGNRFFERLLDPSMMYSAALFTDPQSSLHEASLAKLDRICRKLDLGPRDRVVEIGSGWGGFAEFAAEHYGCRVTTTTLSRAQYEYTRARIERAGLSERVEVLLRDYRDLRGSYTKLVSIEMVEAIGADQYRTYLRQISDLLQPDGLALVQAITIADGEFDRARREVDFIKHHIFPGCCLPSVAALTAAMAAASDLRLAQLEDLTPHYARTLALWRANLLANREALERDGYGAEFQRLWEWYLAYCEGGFTERVIHNVQLLFAKPLDRRAPLLPAVLERR
jgi:cyclopropane-fatty-acyl-phospholipid synthase